MAAIVYLILAFLTGDLLCRRLFVFVSLTHRLAAGFLAGLCLITWPTYLLAVAFCRTENPLLWANLLVLAPILVLVLGKGRPLEFRNPAASLGDWVFAGLVLAFACLLMFGTFWLADGKLKMGSVVWNDFGPNLSLVQSFAVGRNFPTEYPHFGGSPIRYHFFFWFLTGNLTFLGLPIDWSLNLLSALVLTAMLVLVAVLGEVLFGSRASGRLGAALFFFHGTLSYIPFLAAAGSPSAALNAVLGLKHWLRSIYPYPGEQWGIWSVGTFLVQRHLPMTMGILLIIVIFVLQNFRKRAPEEQAGPAPDRETFVAGCVFCGILLGLLPLWNSAIFVAGGGLLAAMGVFFPRRLALLGLLVLSAVIALPQVLALKAGETGPVAELFRWGYVVDPPTLPNVAEYFAFTFGLKTALALGTVVLVAGTPRRFFGALASLLALAFFTKLSRDPMNNHKFLHLWMLLLNLYAAYALIAIWRRGTAGKVASVLALMLIAAGGLIELFRLRNDDVMNVPYRGKLYDWIVRETRPEDVFLTHRHVHHPILLAGRRVFYAWPYFGWSMGYNTAERDAVYRELLGEQNPAKLLENLRRNRIAYVAIDDEMRKGEFGPTLNEAVCERYFAKVFVEGQVENGFTVIYRVPPRGFLRLAHPEAGD
jgi:hypothetical protein